MEAFLDAIEVANLEANSNSGVATKKSPCANNRLRWWSILLVVSLLGGWCIGSNLMRGWVPADEGAYAQSADRILQGELPHRDYFEVYTGGLAYLHAFAFKVLGENFASMRIVLFLFFLAWVPTFFWSASRLVTDWVAGVVTLMAVVWSMPNYSAAAPSWRRSRVCTLLRRAFYFLLFTNRVNPAQIPMRRNLQVFSIVFSWPFLF